MLKRISAFGSKPDYSGFDMDSWNKRDNATHHQKATAA